MSGRIPDRAGCLGKGHVTGQADVLKQMAVKREKPLTLAAQGQKARQGRDDAAKSTGRAVRAARLGE